MCIVVAGVVAVVTGCTTFEETDTIDDARFAQLRDDQWIDADNVSMAEPQLGSNHLYYPTRATTTRRAPGTVAEVAHDELDRAIAAGWGGVYGRCPADAVPATGAQARVPVPDGLTRKDAETGVLVLSRPLSDGATARAVLTLEDRGDGDVEATIRAAAPHHAAAASQAPPRVDLDGLACLGGSGDQSVIGDPESYAARGW